MLFAGLFAGFIPSAKKLPVVWTLKQTVPGYRRSWYSNNTGQGKRFPGGGTPEHPSKSPGLC
jgi:hypothetical protein